MAPGKFLPSGYRLGVDAGDGQFGHPPREGESHESFRNILVLSLENPPKRQNVASREMQLEHFHEEKKM